MPRPHRRRSIRLPGFDYRSRRWYFVTICAHDRLVFPAGFCRGGPSGPFGRLVGLRIALTDLGTLIDTEWTALVRRFPWVVLGPAAVMPDHFHGLVGIDGTHCDRHRAALAHAHGTPRGSLSAAVQAFKTTTSKRWRRLAAADSGSRPSHPLWQRNYWESVIRDGRHLQAVERYIANNPGRLARKWGIWSCPQ